MIHYHGFPTGLTIPDNRVAFAGRHTMFSFAHPESLTTIADVVSTFAVDNGAFSAWKSNTPVNWVEYYEWIEVLMEASSFDFALIPDVIDGEEEENDQLVRDWPNSLKGVGVPVWHLHESAERLRSLCESWPKVAIGSSGEYASLKSTKWWSRMRVAWEAIPSAVKIHGLRMMDPVIVEKFPFHSADSVTAGMNCGVDMFWNGIMKGATKRTRCIAYCEYLESKQPPLHWEPYTTQLSF